MKKTMQIIIAWGFILFLVGMLGGCKEGKGKYVGKWVYKSNAYVESLEIKPDGTYTFYKTGEFGMRYTSTGTWEVKKYEGEEGITFSPPLGYIGALKKKGNTLVEPLMGKTYIKQ